MGFTFGSKSVEGKFHHLDTLSPCSLTYLFKLIQQEILTHRQLEHDNVILMIGIFCEEDRPAPLVVLPYFPNGSALKWLMANEGALNFTRIVG